MPKKTTLTKILLSLAALGAISVAAIGGTFANFTATPTSISSNAFASGTLTMNASSTAAIFNSAAMKIGDTVNGQITITNTGTLSGAYTLQGASSGSAALASQLKLVVYKDTDGSGSPVYNGSLGAFSSAGLGTFTPNNDAHTFFFHVSFPSSGTDAGDNLLQGLSASESFTWTATQV